MSETWLWNASSSSETFMDVYVLCISEKKELFGLVVLPYYIFIGLKVLM